jgi:hypothetical protein
LNIYKDFKSDVLEDEKPETVLFVTFLREKATKNLGIELINKYFREHCSRKGIWHNKDFNRYYFAKQSDNILESSEKDNRIKKVYRRERYKSKQDKSAEREVVTWYSYYDKTSYYRHFAFEIGYYFDGNSLFVAITPKYLFTSDGRNVLEDRKKVTKYTNFLTSREFNQQVLNHIYFVVQYLSDRKGFVLAKTDVFSLELSNLIKLQVPFGIMGKQDNALNKYSKPVQEEPIPIQQELF